MWYLRISPTFVHIHAKRHEIEPHIRATNAHVQRTHQSNNAREEKKIYKIYVEYNFEMFGWHMRRCLSIHRALTAQNIISRRCERKEEVRDEIEKKNCWHKKKLPTVRAAATTKSTKAIAKWSQGVSGERKMEATGNLPQSLLDRIELYSYWFGSTFLAQKFQMKYLVRVSPYAHTNMNGVFLLFVRSFVRSLHLYNGKYV